MLNAGSSAGPPASATHDVILFDHGDTLASAVGRVLGSAIEQGHGALAIFTREHLRSIDSQFELRGIDVAAARARRQYLSFDAAETLAAFSRDGAIDEEHFRHMASTLLDDIFARYSRVSASGANRSVS